MTLVLLSGWGIDARIWQPLASYWPPGIEVNTPDWPGYGTRAGETTPATLAELASAMSHVLSADAVWVGWSFGGLLAGSLLAHLPAPRALVLMGIGSRFCSEDGVTPAELATFRRAFEREPHATWQHFLRWQLQGEPSPRSAHCRLVDLLGRLPSASGETLALGLEQLGQLDLSEQFLAPSCPIRRLIGERDPLVGETARQAADMLLADNGHCPMLTRPDNLTSHLVMLLQDIVQQPKAGEAVL
ncbi:alpha/beta fold hydrolase [Billgrantia sp. LNSP4103-1]|uniref:alpha/beta fold hydrolase n=1 Tax=Billgrantia sp. LNSP4103-1 TaxID=3410266 RepID=UPI00403F0276